MSNLPIVLTPSLSLGRAEWRDRDMNINESIMSALILTYERKLSVTCTSRGPLTVQRIRVLPIEKSQDPSESAIEPIVKDTLRASLARRPSILSPS